MLPDVESEQRRASAVYVQGGKRRKKERNHARQVSFEYEAEQRPPESTTDSFKISLFSTCLTADGVASVVGLDDGQCAIAAVLLDEPHPARAKVVLGRLGELGLEGAKAAVRAGRRGGGKR